MSDLYTYYAYVYNPNNGGTYTVPVPAQDYNTAIAIAESQYGVNLRQVKVAQD
jgi:Flp pilus assembly secretin CpaC